MDSVEGFASFLEALIVEDEDEAFMIVYLGFTHVGLLSLRSREFLLRIDRC